MPEFFKIIGDHTRSIHAEGCCLLASVPPACLIPVTDLRREYSRGYDLCEDCSPLRKMFQAEEEELSAFCSQYHITSTSQYRRLDPVGGLRWWAGPPRLRSTMRAPILRQLKKSSCPNFIFS